MENILGIILSFVVVALTVYAVALFITSGANLNFYTVVVIDLIISFINSWLISSGRYEKARIKTKKKKTSKKKKINRPLAITYKKSSKRRTRKKY